jgi:hypothetical protein
MAYLGRGAAIGLGEESTWGTAVSRDNWRPLISSNLTRTVERIPRADLHSDAAAATRKGHYDLIVEAGGTAEMLATYDNIGMLLKHACGALATTGGGPYTHTYTLSAALPTGLTLEFIRGTGTSEVFEGCKINQATLACSAGEAMTLSVDFIAEDGAARGSAGTPTYAAVEQVVLYHHAGQMSIAGNNYSINSLSLVLNNNLTRRNLLGSDLTKEPVRGDFTEITMSVEVEAADQLYADLRSGAQADATITFTGTGSKSLAITLQNAYLTECTDPVNDAGIVSQSLTLVGESDGTDYGLKIEVGNADATGIGN